MPANIERSNDGYLVHLEDWNPPVAQALAAEANLFLTEDHWAVLQLLREHYQSTKMTISMRALIRLLQDKWPAEKANSAYLQSLFPLGVLRQGYMLAGLPRPAKCM